MLLCRNLRIVNQPLFVNIMKRFNAGQLDLLALAIVVRVTIGVVPRYVNNTVA
jgi:uncharacterized membrane protein